MLLKWVTLCVVVSIAVACTDGVHNVIKIHDISGGNGMVVLHDVEIWTYGKYGEPICSGYTGLVRMPGYIRIAKGKVEVRQPVSSKTHLRALVSAEKDSYWIGEVCRNGKSKHMMVSESMCEHSLNSLIPGDIFSMFASKGHFDINAFITKDLIPVGPLPSSRLPGPWKASLTVVTSGGDVVTKVRLGDSGRWLEIGGSTHAEL